MTKHGIINEYFEWLSDLVCEKRYSKQVSYDLLLEHLHSTEFRYSIPNDYNRAHNGIALRYSFALSHGYDDEYVTDVLRGPCSVLEMMIAVAIYCEEHIMDDPRYGNRTGQWFWGMIVNLGLGAMIDRRFDSQYVDDVLNRFLDREYEPDGRGGLFTIHNSPRDLRDVEIFTQMCWHLDNII